jgi:hypothetical protein
MKCKNCGGHTRQGDTYCPNCGMELSTSEYKPLQKSYIRGEYQEREENFHNERPEYDDPETTEYERGYDYDYAEPKKSGGKLLPVILILIIALLIGFILGVIMFSSNFQSVPSIG